MEEGSTGDIVLRLIDFQTVRMRNAVLNEQRAAKPYRNVRVELPPAPCDDSWPCEYVPELQVLNTRDSRTDELQI